MTMLDHLRTEIEAVDTQLLELIAKRLELAVKVGRQKEKMSIPIRDWSVEIMEKSKKYFTEDRKALSPGIHDEVQHDLDDR